VQDFDTDCTEAAAVGTRRSLDLDHNLHCHGSADELPHFAEALQDLGQRAAWAWVAAEADLGCLMADD
jgi:hypothetical protein